MNTETRHIHRTSADHHADLDAMHQILQNHLSHNPPPPNCKYNLHKLLTYVHEHLFDPELNCTQALMACGLGDHNITTQFRLEMGCSLKSYIEQHRLTVAKEAMTHTNLPLYLIADAVGYSNVSTLTNAFYRVYKIKPSGYRDNVQKSPSAEKIKEKNGI